MISYKAKLGAVLMAVILLMAALSNCAKKEIKETRANF